MRQKIRMMLWMVITVSIAMTTMGCNPGTEEKQPAPEATVAEHDNSIDVPDTSKPDTPPDGTALPIENIEDWFVPQPVPELDEGNEIYLDADVIGKLSVLEESGEEDLVNAILDGEILLINHFVRKDYSAYALCQIQRFYFAFYDNLKNESFDVLARKMEQCIGNSGAEIDGFAEQVSSVFGWITGQNYFYVFESEGHE